MWPPAWWLPEQNLGSHARMKALYGLTVLLFVQVTTCSVFVPVAAALFVGWDALHELILNAVCSPSLNAP